MFDLPSMIDINIFIEIVIVCGLIEGIIVLIAKGLKRRKNKDDNN